MRILLFTLPLFAFVCGCGESPAEKNPPADHSTEEHGHTHAGGSHHGAIVGLGTVELSGERFTIARHGDCEPGKEGAFVVTHLGAGSRTGLYLWVEDEDGNQVSAPAQGDASGSDFHFHVTPRTGAKAPSKVTLRLRDSSTDERASLPVFASAKPLRDGVAAPLKGAGTSPAGWLELKLHDDKGDLELWLARDASLQQPLDLPLDAVIKVTFLDQANRSVELRVRNTNKNEDEDGKPTNRNGKTNYFIFPGESGADASWLVGGEFRSAVRVTVPSGEAILSSPEFVLIPHGHGPGGHKH